MINDQLLNENDLMEKLEIKQRTKLREALEKLKVPYKLLPNGKIITSLSAFNMGLHGYGTTTTKKQNDFEFA